MEEEEVDAHVRKKAKKHQRNAAAAAASPSPAGGDAVVAERVNVDFKKLQIVPMGAAHVIQQPWLGILDEVVVRMSRLTMLASRFLTFYIARVFSSDVRILPQPRPSADDGLFQKEFFEHLFKAVTCDTSVAFEPALQFARCVWLHALLLQYGVTDLEPLDEACLWEEIRVEAESKVRVKEENAVKKKKQKKKEKEKRTQPDTVEDEEGEGEANGPRAKKKGKTADGTAITRPQTSPLAARIVKHSALIHLLPSCAQIDQCIKYASVAYRTAFVQYQVTGLRTHVGWLLLAKYRLSKKQVRDWLEMHFPEQLINQDDTDEETSEGPDVAREAEAEADIDMGTDPDVEMEDDTPRDSETRVNGDDGRAVFDETESHFQATRLSACMLVKKPKKRLFHVVRLHHAILQEIESVHRVTTDVSSSSSSTAVAAVTTATTAARQFALAPLSKWHRRFVRFDAKILNDLQTHPIYLQTHPQYDKRLHREAWKQAKSQRERDEDKSRMPKAPEPVPIISTSDIFNVGRIRLSAKEKRGVTLAPTFTTDGVQLHLAWQKIVTLSCLVDPKKRAAYEAKEKKKAETPTLSANGQVDRRTLKKVIPTLAGSDGPRFWKKTTRLEEHDYGIFQTASLLASRSHAQEQGRPFRLSDLPFQHIVAIDPGHSNVICSAVWDHAKQDWKKGRNLSKSEYYRELGQQHVRRRTEIRMKREVLGKRVAAHMDYLSTHSPKTSSPVDCLQHLLYASGACWDDLFAFYGSRNAARERFRSEQKRQRLVANLTEKLVPEHLKSTSLVVLGSATFATSMKGSQATPIGRLIKELAKSRRIVLVDEFFTTQMCSGCNLSGVGSRHSRTSDKSSAYAPASSAAIHSYALRSTSTLRVRIPVASTKPHHVHHPTCSMASFQRTIEPAAMRTRRERREAQRVALWSPDPGESDVTPRRKFDPLSAPIHGLKQCVHCGQ